MTDEELRQVIAELNDLETDQDIAITEKNIALMREQQDMELRVCVKEFFDKYLNRREESDGGKMFNPIVVSCCRVMMTEPLNNLLARMAKLSGAKPKESHD
jgi:3'-phosphoadenosine 5'-phosphosulfate sulfotransferase (PAPS reductase)/FAD synthetase